MTKTLADDPLVKTALEAAALASTLVRESMGDDLEVTTKSNPRDFVTRIDVETEALIRKTIMRDFPEHSILGEEQGLTGTGPYCWVIDPVDGTSNFIRGLPHFAVSVGLTHKGERHLGVVANPNTGETYLALKGQGAVKNQGTAENAGKLAVNLCTDLDQAFVTMSFSADVRVLSQAAPVWNALLTQCQGLRRWGSTALELSLLAEGKIDGFVGFGQGVWDYTAGALLVEEAGGSVRVLDDGTTVFAAASEALLEQLAAYLP